MVTKLIGAFIVSGLCVASAQGTHYQYDTLNRLTSAVYSDGTSVAYAYDLAGNRLSQIISNPSIPIPKVGTDKTALTFSAAAGQAATVQSIALTNGGGGSLQWIASPTASWLSVTPGSGTNSGTVNVTASAAGMPAGTYNANITILASASNAPLSIPVIFTVTGAQGNPLVSSGGIVSAAGSSPGIARGSVASIYGSALADLPASATTVPLPLALVNVQVSVNGLKAPLWYVGPGQINFQVPFEAPLQGQASVIVSRDGVASAPSNVTLTPYAPSVFMYQRTATALDPIIVHASNNQLVTPADPAVPNEYIVVYGTGIGDVTVTPVTGDVSPSNPTAQARVLPTATIGGVNATVTYAGLTAESIGLAQFNIQLPSSLPFGNPLPLVISFGSVASPPVNLAVPSSSSSGYSITTIAGNGATGFSGDGGPAINAVLNSPISVALDATGNLYFSDLNARIRKIDASSGVITTMAGTGVHGYAGDGGPATNALLGGAGDVAVDSAGNIYFADENNYRVRKVAASTGIITTVAGNGGVTGSGDGGPALSASIGLPSGMAVDREGNLYFTSAGTLVRKVSAATGIITTVAGGGSPQNGNGDGGPATLAGLATPAGVAVDTAGDIYILCRGENRIRFVNATTGIITTVAGSQAYPADGFGLYPGGFAGDGGPAVNALLNLPSGIAVDAAGNLYITDLLNYRVRVVNASTGIINTVAGTGVDGFSGDNGLASTAQISGPAGIAVNAAGKVYFGDQGNNRIRLLTPVP